MKPNPEKNHGGRDVLIKGVDIKVFSCDLEDAANISYWQRQILICPPPISLGWTTKIIISLGLINVVELSDQG